MNVCARLEAHGSRGRIHTSKETADLITKAGKGDWLERRVDLLNVKGKGTMETFFVNVSGGRAGSVVSKGSSTLPGIENTHKYGPPMACLGERTQRLVDWNVEMLLQLMKQVVASRPARSDKKRGSITHEAHELRITGNPLDEVREIISLPAFDNGVVAQDVDSVKIPREVIAQLHLLVSEIACRYNDNPFHNFDVSWHSLFVEWEWITCCFN